MVLACTKGVDPQIGDLGKAKKFGVLIDFMSLPQRGYTSGYDASRDDRSRYEIARFGRGLTAINGESRAPPQPRRPRARFLPPRRRLSRALASTRSPPRLARAVWYAHQYTNTLVLDLPMPAGAENQAPIGTGWGLKLSRSAAAHADWRSRLLARQRSAAGASPSAASAASSSTACAASR